MFPSGVLACDWSERLTSERAGRDPLNYPASLLRKFRTRADPGSVPGQFRRSPPSAAVGSHVLRLSVIRLTVRAVARILWKVDDSANGRGVEMGRGWLA